ncbi:MAG: class I SAM-dependent methyltransferase [Actinomycetota bacterium]|nr:class I SAM-dependent methyltransferase [Actinomycetota bacterium]
MGVRFRQQAARVFVAEMEENGMSMGFYKFAYRVGFTPWEQAAQQGPVAQQVEAWFAREESGREPPYGKALDLGCGTGRDSVELATRGWQVTGIDMIPKAIGAARARAKSAGMEVEFLEGDVTALRAAGVGTGFQLVLDGGTIHGFKDEQRQVAAGEVSAVAAPDATLLIFAFAPGRRGPTPRGMSRKDIESAFSGWTVTDEESVDVSLPKFLKAPDPSWYRLRRQTEQTGMPEGSERPLS